MSIDNLPIRFLYKITPLYVVFNCIPVFKMSLHITYAIWSNNVNIGSQIMNKTCKTFEGKLCCIYLRVNKA